MLAVTSPEILRFDSQLPIVPAARRACLLIAKVLMPVAAEITLGRKEPYLEPLNDQLVEARRMMRQYLFAVSEVRLRPA